MGKNLVKKHKTEGSFVAQKLTTVKDRRRGVIIRGEVRKREAIVMWRGLYHDHWLLGAHKDTMPRRKWLKLIGSTIAASTFIRTSSGQQPSPSKQLPVTIDEAGAPES